MANAAHHEIPYRSELERIGVLAPAAWEAFCESADQDGTSPERFLAWLRENGMIDGRQLIDLHRSSPSIAQVDEVIHSPTLIPREWPVVDERFEMLGLVGSGGMGTVYLARDRELRRKVAIKQLKVEVSKKPVLVSRFLAEAVVTAQLDHPNIVPVYGLEQTRDGLPAYSMKLVRGQSLSKLILDARERCLQGFPEDPQELGRRLEVFVKACDGMAYAHEQGVLHRDLKPDNIMLGRHGEAFVLDWGLARYESQPAELIGDEESTRVELGVPSGHTRAGSTLGTPPYMSPEQAMGRLHGPASDQYALGLILFELVTLKRALDGNDVREVMRRAARGDLAPVEHFAKRPIAPDLVAIIQRATALQVSHRYPSVAALADDVRRHLQGLPVAARPDTPWRASLRWMQRHPGWIVALIAAVAIISVVTVGGAAYQTQRAHAELATRQRVAANLAVRTSRQRAEIDAAMLRWAVALQSLGDSVVQQVSEGAPAVSLDAHAAWRESLRDGSARVRLRSSVGYNLPVTFEQPMVLAAPNVDTAGALSQLLQIAPSFDQLGRAYRRAISDEAVAWPSQRVMVYAETEGLPLAWVYVGFEQGFLVNYPGLANLDDAYDPRERTWYRATRGTRGLRWGAPYSDASGFAVLVPSNVALYDSDGRFFGVAGLDVTIDELASLLNADRIAPNAQAWLITSAGGVIVGPSDVGLRAAGGIAGNQPIERPTFDEQAVVDAIANGAQFGLYESSDGAVYLYDRLATAPWTYVVRVPVAD